MSELQVPVTSDDHSRRSAHAPVTLVEYGDYECPYCGEAVPIVKAVQNRFGTHIRLVFRNFPLTQIHPQAESAAETAEFAGAHERFWDMHDGLYEDQEALGLPRYLDLAKALHLSAPALSEALDHRSFRSKVRSDFMGGVSSGVNGTPTFFINGRRHDGGFEFDDLVAAIDAELAKIGAAG